MLRTGAVNPWRMHGSLAAAAAATEAANAASLAAEAATTAASIASERDAGGFGLVAVRCWGIRVWEKIGSGGNFWLAPSLPRRSASAKWEIAGGSGAERARLRGGEVLHGSCKTGGMEGEKGRRRLPGQEAQDWRGGEVRQRRGETGGRGRASAAGIGGRGGAAAVGTGGEGRRPRWRGRGR